VAQDDNLARLVVSTNVTRMHVLSGFYGLNKMCHAFTRIQPNTSTMKRYCTFLPSFRAFAVI
jgi:hypothetical protein